MKSYIGFLGGALGTILILVFLFQNLHYKPDDGLYAIFVLVGGVLGTFAIRFSGRKDSQIQEATEQKLSVPWSIKKPLKLFFVVFFIIIGVGVTALLSSSVTYDDVSSNPEYSRLINTEYKTIENMYIYGLREEGNSTKPLHSYDITEVNFSGPEVFSKDVLKKGTLLKIKSVEKTTNFLIKWQNISDTKYTVDITSPFEANGKPIYIRSDTLSSSTIQK